MVSSLSTGLLVLITITTLSNGGFVSALTAEDETQVCSFAQKNTSLCTAQGPADEGCTSVATAVGGTEPTCHDAKVCSFTKDGAPIYVTSDSKKAGYEIIRNCVNEFGIANPNPSINLGSFESTTKYIGKTGEGKYEKPAISPRRLCNETDNESIGNCQKESFRNDIIKNFHPDLRIGNLAGGFCMEITELNETGGVVNKVCRCVMQGTYVDAASGQMEMLRLHFFNQENEQAVAVMAYYGNKSLELV